MSSRSLPLLALLVLTLGAAPLARGEQPPADDRDRDGYSDRDGYEVRGYHDSRSLQDEVQEAIARALGSDAARISVEVRGRHVYLTGSVRDIRSRAIAHDVAHDVPGVRRVVVRGLYVGRFR